MKFSKLTVNNWRSIPELELEFPNTSSVVEVLGKNRDEDLGGNGVGKSTLLVDAPLWCLTGRPPMRVIPWYNEDEPSSVVMHTDFGVIARSSNPKGKNSLTVDGEEVETEEVVSLMGLHSHKLLRHSVFFPQMQEPFVQMRPAVQNELLSTVMNVTHWLAMRDKLRRYAKQADADLVLRNAAVNTVAQRLMDLHSYSAGEDAEEWERNRKKDLCALHKQSNSLSLSIDTLGDKIDKAAQDLEELESEIERNATLVVREKKEQYNEIMDKLDAAKLQIGGYAARIIDMVKARKHLESASECPTCLSIMSDPEDRADVLKTIDERIASVEKRQEAAQEQLEVLEAAASTAMSKAHAANKHRANLRDCLAKDKGALSEMRREYTRLEETFDAVMHRKQTLKKETNPFKREAERNDRMEGLLQSMQRVAKRAVEYATEEALTANASADHLRELTILSLEESFAALEAETAGVLISLGMDLRVRYTAVSPTKAGKEVIRLKIRIDDGETERDLTSLSGGELTRVCIAVQMAVANLIHSACGVSPNIEVWDEPSTWISQEGTDDLLDILNNRAQAYGRTIYLIDHRSSVARGPALLLEKKDGRTALATADWA